ncbi:MAG: hypothetical protein JW955_15565 [Sedimentisphaerales bacterium]|nr:hypothetical protein [Sedimentisphaerales bacterium]
MPVQLPMTLQEFVEYTGWEDGAPRDRLHVALDYFQAAVPLSYLSQPVKDPVSPEGKSLGPNPWLLPRPDQTDPRPSGPNSHRVPNKARAKVPINLCMLMQTINFSYPVSVRLIPQGALLSAFRTTHSPTGGFGHFFTLLQTSPTSLAIPHDQIVPEYYEAIRSFTALASTVADAYVDWAMHRGVGPQYRHGGGLQFYIWDPKLRLRSVPAPAGAPLRSDIRGD